MLFNSLDFLVFFIVVFVLYWSIPNKFRWLVLLASSYFFYAYWNPIYVLLLLASTLIDYIISLKLTQHEKRSIRKIGLILSLLLNFGILFSFKYYNFFVEIFNQNIAQIIYFNKLKTHSIIFPIGISFYTFQTVSYTIDVYLKKINPERNFGKFALYIAFFPQLVAGPIERAGNLIPQIDLATNVKISWINFVSGLKLILWGLFLKVVVADNLSDLVDSKLNYSVVHSGGAIAFGIVLFAFQLYTDFNGYSKMAVGLAKLLGYNLSMNFDYPFTSSSFNQLWRKWHISLSTWVKDYIFIPLGGSKRNFQRTILNINISFVLMGIWHGASYNHILWGIICGLLFSFEIVLWKYVKVLHYLQSKMKIMSALIIFLLFCLSIVPIRANNLDHTLQLYSKLLEFKFFDFYFWFADNKFAPGMIGLYIVVAIEFWFGFNFNNWLNLKNKTTESIFYFVTFFLIVLLGKDAGSEFIYFQF
jgi:alginate O-acetyltransferase complex protein AlgI